MLPWLVLGLTNCTSTPGSPAARWWRPSARTTSAPPRPRACGPTSVLFKHALRAAIVPVITIFGLDFATLLAGTIFTEQIFSIDGIGHWGLQALQTPIDINVDQRHRAGRRGPDRGRQPARRHLLQLPRPAGERRLSRETPSTSARDQAWGMLSSRLAEGRPRETTRGVRDRLHRPTPGERSPGHHPHLDVRLRALLQGHGRQCRP